MKFDKFEPAVAIPALRLAIENSKYPDVTREALYEARDWLNDDGNFEIVCKILVDKWSEISEAEPEKPDPADNKVDLKFVQTKQLNEECGFWFTKTNLRVIHSFGENNYPGGEVFMKKTHGKTGRFRADLSDIPLDAEIQKATLVMTLERHEGIANADRESIFEIRNGKDIAIAEITADWINTHFQKYSNPNVIIDLSDYFKRYR